MARGLKHEQEILTTEERKFYYTPGEVAEMFGVTPKTVSNWCDRGLLQYTQTLAGHRRILASSIKGGRSHDERLAAFRERMARKRAGRRPPTGKEIAERIHAARAAGQGTEVIDVNTAIDRIQDASSLDEKLTG